MLKPDFKGVKVPTYGYHRLPRVERRKVQTRVKTSIPKVKKIIEP